MILIYEVDGYEEDYSNPCRGMWSLCRDPTEYIHSSAKFYMTGEDGICPVTQVGDSSKINWTSDESYKLHTSNYRGSCILSEDDL